MKRWWPWAVACVTLLALPAAFALVARARTPELPRLGRLPEFALTDQTGRPFGTRELRGQVFVADFIFTRCAMVCPRLTEKMATLRGGPALLVSITVDPDNDTPEALAAYGARFGADARTWKFLTGSSKEIERAVVEGFKQGMEREDEFSILHGTKLVLVDADLELRGFYDSADEAELARLRADAAALVRRGGR